MSSLKNLASKIVNGSVEIVNVWRRETGEIVVVCEDSGGQPTDRWNGPAGEWKRALTEALAKSVATLSRANHEPSTEAEYHDPMYHSGDRP